ncbi:sister chromatid cohesion protein DCC1 [Eupeodes corollae]|uniref:sister chromatid cohesion protein DCC1 n=1 Tax=Eupeodes corollae TaxID=290404 RepID=UPI0024926B70|nr:sister chromatid cohesion protein DCC1 [Eupeodes corollae]XP_055918040.1 sister chromatid cohesion protein DCC1 [Eupeodes corollae]
MNAENVMEVDETKIEPPYIRTPEDVKQIIEFARMDERNLTPVTQSFYFPSNNCSNERFRLLELNPHLLKTIRDGGIMSFKGGLHESAVLCTNEKTYEVKETEISNSLVLVPELKFAAQTSSSPLKSPRIGADSSMERINNKDDSDDDEVAIERVLEQKKILKIFYEYYECREIQPRFRKLNDLLLMTRFSGPENEYMIEKKLLFTFSQLLDTIQCSRKQFEEGLKKVRALIIDGFVRVLDCEYEFRIINLMMAVITENSWPLDGIEKDETIAALEGIAPKQIVEGIFNIYTHPVDSNPGKFQYKEELLARIIAVNILKPGLKFRVEEFMSDWQDALVEGYKVDQKYLQGIGIIDLESKPPCIRSLNEENLTTNLQDRIDLLFKIKTSWILEEIESYLEYFTTPTMNVSTLLAKYARSFVVDGVRRYVSKYK